jgi:SAM-dependent methyltransferase
MSVKQVLLRAIKRQPALYTFLRYDVYARLQALRRRKVFLAVYRNNYWDGTYSISGPGSTAEATQRVRAALPDLLAKLEARSLLDIPCGDFQWMKDVSLGRVHYIGADIVHPLIEENRKRYGDRGEFLHLDLLRDPLPRVDVVFCRDCLIHLSFREINAALRNIGQAAPKYFVTTTFPHHAKNADTVSPYWRALNFQAEPFGFPAPLRLIEDFAGPHDGQRDKYLAVWRGEDIAERLAASLSRRL